MDGYLQKIIDSRLLRPMSRGLVTTFKWLLARWEYVLAVICFGVGAAYFLYLVFVTHNIFWDIDFYSAVVKTMAAGFSPYDNVQVFKTFGSGNPAGFVYPPLVAETFYKLRWLFLTPAGWVVLVTTHVISWILIPYLQAGSPKDWYSRKFLYIWGLYLVFFGLGGMRLLVVGNLSGMLYALMILSIIVAVRTGDYKCFWATILVCSFVKIYFLGFLLLPVILDKRYISAVVLICALIALYALNYLFSQELFSEYIVRIAAQPSNTNNIGLSIFSLVAKISEAMLRPNDGRLPVIALGIHMFLVVIIFLFAYAIAERRVRPASFDLFCCWLFMSAFLISPRIFDYDLAVVIVPFVLLGRMLLVERGLGTGVAAIVAVLGFTLLRTPLMFKTPLSEWSATFTILGVWLGAAIHWLVDDVRCHSAGSNSAEPI
jgi:hypothetical protein